MIFKWRQSSQSNRHSTIGTRQTQYYEALPSSANEVRCDCTFTNNGNASWYSVYRVLMVEWRLDCENCSHLTVVGLHDTSPWVQCTVPGEFSSLYDSPQITISYLLITKIMGSRPEWCISTIYHAWDTPFWLGTLEMDYTVHRMANQDIGRLPAYLTSQQQASVSHDHICSIVQAAMLRQKLQIKLSISPCHSILTPGWPVPALTL